MDFKTIDNIITIAALVIGLGSILFCAYHHFFIKPKQDERMKQLDRRLKQEMLKQFKKGD